MRLLSILTITLISFYNYAQKPASWEHEKIEVVYKNNQDILLGANNIIEEGWSDLAQPKFWQNIMTLGPDSCIVNIAKNRVILEIMSNNDWNSKSQLAKDQYRDSVRQLHGLDPEDRIFVTTGKNDFYKFDVVYSSISDGISEFEKNNVDPWYAQAILLIESPGQLKKSKAGAYGLFQLMPGVARAQGLTVNKYTDERSDFVRSAYGSSQLIKTICIPEAKRILDNQGLSYQESDLWFRLFVLHVYHAGSLNVKAVVDKINPTEGGQSLIKEMWITSAASFGNNSQNYSQLALASQLILNKIVHAKSDYIHTCASIK